MPDNRPYLRDRLGKLDLSPHREEEILRELSDHLADHAAVLETRGKAGDVAVREALSAVSDWPRFREEIVAAETEEMIMNYRSKALWLPALGALTLSNGLLALIQVFGPPPRFYVFHSGKNVEIFCGFVFPWLITQAVVGGIAAYWSRRAGGAMRHQVLAALAPAIAQMGLFLVVLLFAVVVKPAPVNVRLSAFLVLTVTWVLLPALPLLLGAVPFMRKPLPQS